MQATHIPHLNRRAMSAALLGLFAGAPAFAQKPTLITDPRTPGPWRVYRYGDATAGNNAWRANAFALPDPFYNLHTQAGIGQQSGSWRAHPRMREKLRRILDAFRSAEPEPMYANGHAIILGSVDEPKGAVLDRYRMYLGYSLWLYDAAGKIVENKVRMGGFMSDNWALVQVNGHSAPGDVHRAFTVVPELSYGANESDPLPLGEIRLVRPVRELVSKVRVEMQSGELSRSLVDVAPMPKGLGTVAFITIRPKGLQGATAPAQFLKAEYCIFLAAGDKLTVHNFLTQAEVLSILELKSRRKVKFFQDLHASQPLPDAPNRRAGELASRATELRRWENAVRVVDRLRQVFAASLNTEAVVHQRYLDTISEGVPVVLADEEYVPPINKREYPLDGLFLANPAEGYRFARVNTPYYANMKPGEIRSIQINFEVKWRIPGQTGFGKAEPAGDYTDWADVPGNFHHSILNNFNWDALKAVLGD